jgi:hypothetical protein
LDGPAASPSGIFDRFQRLLGSSVKKEASASGDVDVSQAHAAVDVAVDLTVDDESDFSDEDVKRAWKMPESKPATTLTGSGTKLKMKSVVSSVQGKPYPAAKPQRKRGKRGKKSKVAGAAKLGGTGLVPAARKLVPSSTASSRQTSEIPRLMSIPLGIDSMVKVIPEGDRRSSAQAVVGCSGDGQGRRVVIKNDSASAQSPAAFDATRYETVYLRSMGSFTRFHGRSDMSLDMSVRSRVKVLKLNQVSGSFFYKGEWYTIFPVTSPEDGETVLLAIPRDGGTPADVLARIPEFWPYFPSFETGDSGKTVVESNLETVSIAVSVQSLPPQGREGEEES